MVNNKEIINNALFWAGLKYLEKINHFVEKMQESNADRKDCIESINNFCKMYDETKKLMEKRKVKTYD